jgi:hypothetical protein
MSDRRVTVVFDAIAQRWEVAEEAAAGRGALEQVANGVSVASDAVGRIIEVVVDADDEGRVPAVGAQLVKQAFGAQVAALLGTTVHDDDFETVVVLPLANLPVQRADTTPSLPNEPGVPTARPDGSFDVAYQSITLRLEVHPGRLVVRAPKRTADETPWAVVADGSSGTLLALGALEPSGDSATAAHLTYGLSVPPEDLHVRLEAEPLTPLPERSTRRRTWAAELLAKADRDLRFHPRRAAAAAAQAREVGELLDDSRVVERATNIERRARRSKLWWLAGGAVIVAGGVGVGFAMSGGSDTTPQKFNGVYYESCDDARAAGPTPLYTGDPGYRPGLDRDGDGVACEG